MFNSLYRHYVKRILDVTFATLASVLLAPVLMSTAILVACKLGRPVLFRQLRPGEGGKPFELIKFRTMTDCRDGDGNLLPDEERLTSFGKRLRSTSIDELPALWNILLGDMSFVGPRPLLMRYLTRYNATQSRRHDVRPGLTGLAQVNGRNLLAWEERFELDVEYVKNLSLWQDIKIVISTFGAVFAQRGITHEGSATMPEFMGTTNPQSDDNRVYVIGAGGHAKVVIALLQRLSYEVEGIFDDNVSTHGHTIRGAKILGNVASATDHPRRPTILAIGDNSRRQELANTLDLPWLTAIHPNASVDDSVRLGEGTIVMDGSIVQPDTVIGDHVIVNTAASIDHDGFVDSFSHIAPGCRLAGGVTVGKGTLLGLGSVVLPQIRIGNGCTIGAGSVVVNSIDDAQIAMGVPAQCKPATIQQAA